MSEQVTAKRLWAARTARRFPVILHMVERGELHLGAIHLLAKHLTAENHVQVLERAKHKSSREVEQLAAELAPQADVASRIRAMPGPRGAAAQVDSPATAKDERPEARDQADSVSNPPVPRTTESGSVTKPIVRTTESGSATKPIVPLSPRRYKIEITVDEATHDKLRSLQDLMARSATGRDPAAIISRAIDVLHLRTLARKAGSTDRPKAACADRQGSGTRAADTADSERTRAIPAAVRREVWRRDCGRCCYVDARGRRCGETSNVEFHHRDPLCDGRTAHPAERRAALRGTQPVPGGPRLRSFLHGREAQEKCDCGDIPRGMSGGCSVRRRQCTDRIGICVA